MTSRKTGFSLNYGVSPFGDVDQPSTPLSGEELNKIFFSDEFHATWDMLRHPNATPEMLHAGAESENEEAQCLAAEHPNTDATTQVLLAKKWSLQVDARLCRRKRLAEKARDILGDPERKLNIAWLVAYGHGTPELLNLAEKHPDHRVRRTLAIHSIDPDTLTRLAFDTHRLVRKAVAENPVCPENAHVIAALN